MTDFYVMLKDRKTAFVKWIDKDTAEVTAYDDDVFNSMFRSGIIKKDIIMHLLSWRLIPKTRPDLDKILKTMGIDHYDEELILRKTHGLIRDDYNWIMFADENIDYDSIKIRLTIRSQV